MRNSNKLLYIICILGLFTLCCSEDNNSLDTNNPQTVACLSVGYVWCNGLCINPLTSNQYCGINIYCENYKTCDKEETCQNGVCRSSSVIPITPDCPDGNCQDPEKPATTCALDEHKYYNGCEKDSVEHCGNHDTSCAVEISGWADGNCIKGTCHVTACQNDMHPDENACVYDTVQDCGKKGFACADRVPGWKTGACSDGQCKVMQCIDGYHVDDKMSNCVMDTAQCCGTACTKCTNNQICSGSQCRGQCPANTKVCNGACIDVTSSIEHCGECNHNCNANKPAHAQTMRCSQSQCQISECETNYRLESQNGAQVCKADTINSCGSDGTKCNQYEWWGDGSCTNGICIPSACKGDYYLAKNNSGQNVCEPNDDNNCGGHGIKCTGGKCVEGRCLGDALCNGVTHNLLDDLDHCGKCNNRCKDGLVCDNGKCKVGNGNAYCNGNKVVTGTIDNCGGCADRCKDSLICKDNACVPGAGITYCSGVTKDSRADVDHCGACNHRCAEKLVCDNGVCKTGNGLMYCNGVKIDSTRDSEHCGGCNNPCTAGTACCTDKASCGEGYYDIGVNTPICFKSTGNVICSGKTNIDRNTDSANCGMCGKKCSIGQICNSESCQTGTGYTYCDGKTINTSDDSNNCGQCSNACPPGLVCKTGKCEAPNVGNSIKFGHYKGKAIKWYILDKDTTNHRIMLLADDVLTEFAYHEKKENITWEKSTIRSWLNGYTSNDNNLGLDYTSNNFISLAFTIEERERISRITVINDNNPDYETPGGANTFDWVFLLSISEVRTLLGTSYSMCRKITCGNGFWWLRTPGDSATKAAVISGNGQLLSNGSPVSANYYRVRPALWLNY